MTLFIAIVFMAELIIAAALISIIIYADKKVLALSARVAEFNPQLEEGFFAFRAMLKHAHKAVEALVCLVRRKKNWMLIKSIILTVVSVFGKGKYKITATALNVMSFIFKKY
jgi:hypothetical protein